MLTELGHIPDFYPCVTKIESFIRNVPVLEMWQVHWNSIITIEQNMFYIAQYPFLWVVQTRPW